MQEELARHSVWLDNKKYIEQHNSNAEERGFTLAMNQFADLVIPISVHVALHGGHISTCSSLWSLEEYICALITGQAVAMHGSYL